MKTAWERLIRFEDVEGRIHYGEPVLTNADVDIGKDGDGLKAKLIVGSDLYDTSGKTYVSDETVAVKKLLGTLAPQDVPILRCVGLNYQKHSAF